MWTIRPKIHILPTMKWNPDWQLDTRNNRVQPDSMNASTCCTSGLARRRSHRAALLDLLLVIFGCWSNMINIINWFWYDWSYFGKKLPCQRSHQLVKFCGWHFFHATAAVVKPARQLGGTSKIRQVLGWARLIKLTKKFLWGGGVSYHALQFRSKIFGICFKLI